jgi:hypothetical protein
MAGHSMSRLMLFVSIAGCDMDNCFGRNWHTCNRSRLKPHTHNIAINPAAVASRSPQLHAHVFEYVFELAFMGCITRGRGGRRSREAWRGW